MTEARWHIEASAQAADMALTLMRHEPTGPLECMHRVEAPTVSLFLTPARNEASGCYGERPEPGSFTPFGALVMVPADLPLHVRLAAAPPRRLLCCRLDRAKSRLMAREDNWAEGLLRSCFDIRSRRIESTLRQLAAEVEAPGLASEIMIEGLGLVLVAELARFLAVSGATRRFQTGGLAPWQLRCIAEAVTAVDGPPPSLADLARQVGLGSRHLMRAFKQSTGRTVMDYVADLRLQRAGTLLAETDLPIAEIGRLLGFAQASGFSHAFRRMTGETPAFHRRRRRA
jgi:AraC family transcriptional regulator